MTSAIFFSFCNPNDEEYIGGDASNMNASVGNITPNFHAIKLEIVALEARILDMKRNMDNGFKNMVILNIVLFRFFVLVLVIVQCIFK